MTHGQALKLPSFAGIVLLYPRFNCLALLAGKKSGETKIIMGLFKLHPGVAVYLEGEL